MDLILPVAINFLYYFKSGVKLFILFNNGECFLTIIIVPFL